MPTYTTTIEDYTGFMHTVEVDYEWSQPIPATHDQSAEGGFELQGVWCKTKKLTIREERLAVEEAIQYAWAVYRGE